MTFTLESNTKIDSVLAAQTSFQDKLAERVVFITNLEERLQGLHGFHEEKDKEPDPLFYGLKIATMGLNVLKLSHQPDQSQLPTELMKLCLQGLNQLKEIITTKKDEYECIGLFAKLNIDELLDALTVVIPSYQKYMDIWLKYEQSCSGDVSQQMQAEALMCPRPDLRASVEYPAGQVYQELWLRFSEPVFDLPLLHKSAQSILSADNPYQSLFNIVSMVTESRSHSDRDQCMTLRADLASIICRIRLMTEMPGTIDRSLESHRYLAKKMEQINCDLPKLSQPGHHALSSGILDDDNVVNVVGLRKRLTADLAREQTLVEELTALSAKVEPSSEDSQPKEPGLESSSRLFLR